MGFICASLLWGGLSYGYMQGFFDEFLGAEVAVVEADAGADADVESEEATKGLKGRRKGRRGRRWKRRGRGKQSPSGPRGSGPIVESGDDLGEGAARELDVGDQGAEEQLSSAQIDAAFGPAMPGIRRCLLHLPPDQSGSGRVTFGLRIAGSGRASALRLHGPSALTTGPVGRCLNAAGRAVRFPTFDGPDMVVRYPITFE